MERDPIVITGMGWEIPGWNGRPLLDALSGPVAYGDFNPQEVLGKKGLRYKDRATLLATCAVHRALQDRGLLGAPPEATAAVGICASSNLGNMDTVCLESEIIVKQHVDRTSPMNLPVASSNVIPASIAIRFGFKAINLMLCNGATSGIDALNTAAQMIRAGRAEKMVVVGVEPLNTITARLLRECDPEHGDALAPPPGELAVCLILERPPADAAVKRYGTVGRYEFLPPDAVGTPAFDPPDVWFVPSPRTRRSRELVERAKRDGFAAVETVDVSMHTGELYGALGVLQAAVALQYLPRAGKRTALLSNGFTFGDGLSSIQLYV